MAIKKPADMDFSQKNIKYILPGLPGVGKTASDLFDADVVLIEDVGHMDLIKED